MASKIGNKYKLKGTETRADILNKIGGSGGGAKRTVKPRKRGGAAGNEPLVKTEAGNITRLTKKQSRRLTKADLADLKKTSRMKGKTGRKKLLRSGTGKSSTTGRDVALAGAGGAAAAYAATKSERKMSPAIKSRVSSKASPKPKKKSQLRKKSASYMTRQFVDGTSKPYKVIKGSQFINQ